MDSALERRFRHPARAGQLMNPAANAVGSAVNVAESLELRLELQTEQGQVVRARFLALGCPATIAVADWLAEAVEGLRLTPDCSLDWSAAEAELALPAEKRSRLLLAEDAFRAALAQALSAGPETVS